MANKRSIGEWVRQNIVTVIFIIVEMRRLRKLERGEITAEQFRFYKTHACPSCGACSFMGTACTMQMMTEALGLSLPGSALVPAASPLLADYARRAGEQAVALARAGIRTGDIVTKEAFENAVLIHAAISGSTNAMLHLPAIAHEYGIELDCDMFDRMHRGARWLLDVRPAGRWPAAYVWYAGGVPRVMERLRDLDPTRPVDPASGWHDQGVSDVKSLHVYFKPYRFRPDKKGRAVVLSEFGGYNLPVAGHTWNTKNFGYKGYQTPEALGEAVKTLYETQIIPARRAGLAADVYTQLSDVEDEVNGFVTYDRRVEKLPEALMQAIAQELRGD